MKPTTRATPPDQAARDRIRLDLGTTFLVEAGAGSGKTKSLVDRMIALLGGGLSTIDTLAAVTFTRKAAAELRGRFQVALEQARLEEKDAAVRARLDAALTGLERSFIGTIHSFCVRLLRERPVEAGIDPEFRELEEHEDRMLLEESWDEYLAKARLENEAALRGLDEAGLQPGDLEGAFKALAEFPDVEAVRGRADPPDFQVVRKELEALIELASKLVPVEKPPNGRDGLQMIFVRLFRRRRNIGFGDGRRLMESVELFDKKLGVTKNRWASKEDAERMLAAALAFQERVAGPALRDWREFRHTRALAFLRPALDFYAGKRRAEARLNFQDQLMMAARLLRQNPEVRRYFRKRFHPILVDEFQDTDPIQAEILFLLAGTDDAETDWTRLRPAPGSLFLVGDPKQSIYRFRRADIDIYNLVKERITTAGGETLALSANFRSLPELARWINPLFDPASGGAFPAGGDATQAGFMPLEAVRAARPGTLSGVRRVTIPAVPHHRKEDIAGLDSARVAGFIAWALAGNLSLDGGKGGRPAQPGDFLVLFRYKDRMSRYARRLEELGIPFEIAGSDAFSENSEIQEVLNLLVALDDPDDPVATVAVLRGMFFGLSDQDLLEHRAAGGGFCYLAGPESAGGSAAVRRAFGVLRGWRDLAGRVPPSAALESILQQAGLLTHLVTAEMGSSRAGNILKLVEVLRGRESEDMTTFAAAVAFMTEWVGATPVEEMSLAPGRPNAVRLMNLHKAKGLEAPVVWLANPAGIAGFEPERHVRRTGKNPSGHFRFTKDIGHRTKTVSQPAGWDQAAGEELKYGAAEENRLMYVAATRARDLLVVSGYGGDLKDKKAWSLLEAGLAGVADLPECPGLAGNEPPCAPPPRGKRTAVKPDEVTKGRQDIRRRMAGASVASSLHETVTSIARREGEAPEWAKGGLGLWGSEVHILLKTFGGSRPGGGAASASPVSPSEELVRMARDVLVVSGKDPAAARDLAGHVAAIIGSGFWLRSTRAKRRLYEVPFSVRIDPGDPDHAGLVGSIGLVPTAGGKPVTAAPGAPVFLSGAIDLLFEEPDGWVLADYKTDRLPAGLSGESEAAREQALQLLVAHYRPQVRLYTRFWAKITGEKVKESGLYFTALGRWVSIQA